MTQQENKNLQVTALHDYHKGLITRTQLLNIVHLLDRKSFAKQWTKQTSSSLSSGVLVYWPHSRCTHEPMQQHLSMNTNQKTDDWLIKNAIGCWLHHFPNHPWTSRYQELVKLDTYLPKTKVQGRRPQAKATRQTKASTKATTKGSIAQPT